MRYFTNPNAPRPRGPVKMLPVSTGGGGTMSLADEVQTIKHAYERDVAPIRGRLVELAADDGRDPAWKQAERRKAIEAYGQVHGRTMTTMREWLKDVELEAAAARASDPVGDAATESRRVSDALEVQRLSAAVASPAQARNQLVPEAERMLALGQPGRAKIFLEAAEQVGVRNGRLRDALEKALDLTVPHRIEARAKLIEGRTLHDQVFLDVTREAHRLGVGVKADGSAGRGERGDLALSSAMAKVRAYALDPDNYSEPAVLPAPTKA